MTRRQLILRVILALGGVVGAALLVFGPMLVSLLRRQVRRSIFEPSTLFSIGPVSDFSVGVNTKFLQEKRVCVVRNSKRLYVIYARCTHLGCTPDWVERDNKFKCPCHASGFCMGSAFDGDGINCEGPASRPLDRAHVELDSEGKVVVNTAQLYQWVKGEGSEFDNPGAYIGVG